MWGWYLVFMKSFGMASYVNKQFSDILLLTHEQSFVWLQYRCCKKGCAQLSISHFAEHFSESYNIDNRQKLNLTLKFSVVVSIHYKAEMHMALWLCYWFQVTQRKQNSENLINLKSRYFDDGSLCHKRYLRKYLS